MEQKYQSNQEPKPTKEKDENPFLISNPFYLDEEERERQEKERLEEEKQRKL
jgi:hypothetical protein